MRPFSRPQRQQHFMTVATSASRSNRPAKRHYTFALGIFLATVLSWGFVHAAQSDMRLRDDAPLKYVVKKGDTLWDISGYFLQDPWYWPELWYTNPDIKNPHLIYPGDVLHLVWIDGRPQLRRGDGGSGRLSPEPRVSPLDDAIPTIPIDAIRQFLRGPRVVGKEQLINAPYIVEFAGEHLMGAAGMRAYAIKLKEEDGSRQIMVRDGEAYQDPETEEIIGFEAIFVGEATVEDFASASTLKIDRTTREVLKGDRLLPNDEFDIRAFFYPRPAPTDSAGRIISVYDGVSQIGQYQIVTLNKGKQDGLEPGHVMKVFRSGRMVRDPHSDKRKATIQLPDEEAGLLMVFKTYDRVSYGLVLKASRAIHVLDKVISPDSAP